MTASNAVAFICIGLLLGCWLHVRYPGLDPYTWIRHKVPLYVRAIGCLAFLLGSALFWVVIVVTAYYVLR